jgi:hypothetical protein
MGRKATEKQKIRMKEYYQENKEKINQENKKRYEKNYKKIVLKSRENYLQNKDKILKRTSEWRKKRWANGEIKSSDKSITQAQGIAKYHIPLKENCEICHSTEHLQRHHWRYDKPLLVNTLCKECHDIQHVKHFETSRFAGGIENR